MRTSRLAIMATALAAVAAGGVLVTSGVSGAAAAAPDISCSVQAFTPSGTYARLSLPVEFHCNKGLPAGYYFELKVQLQSMPIDDNGQRYLQPADIDQRNFTDGVSSGRLVGVIRNIPDFGDDLPVRTLAAGWLISNDQRTVIPVTQQVSAFTTL